jgi:hypothetical protein
MIDMVDIVELHGGVLNAYSEGEGKGSVFFMELPLYLKKENLSEQSDDLLLGVDRSDDSSKKIGTHSEFLNLTDQKDSKLVDACSADDTKLFSSLNQHKPVSTTRKKTPSTRAPPQLGLSAMNRPSGSKVFIAEQDCKEWQAGLNILIVDDSLTNRKVMMKLLSSYGLVISPF